MIKKFENLINKQALWLSNHMWLYWILNFTWGIIMSIIGLIVSLVLIILGNKPQREPSQKTWHFKVKEDWGGVTLGTIYIRDTTSTDHVSYHEYGHTFQNAILGPLFPFLVAIPSCIRYWIFEFRYRKGLPNPDYDDFYVEHSATLIGTTIAENFEK